MILKSKSVPPRYFRNGLSRSTCFENICLPTNLTCLFSIRSYTEVARKTSLQFKDRLIHPTEEGVYWVEYLIRHGPNSLKTEVLNLAWYQYLLLDVICIAIVAILITIWIAYKLFKLLYTYSRKVYTSLNIHKKFD